MKQKVVPRIGGTLSAMNLHSPTSEYNAEPSPSMIVIDPSLDIEGEEILKGIEAELSMAASFKKKQQILHNLLRRAKSRVNCLLFSNFLFYAILTELQSTSNAIEKTFYLNFITRCLGLFELKDEFRQVYIEALIIFLDIEESESILSFVMEVITEIVSTAELEEDYRYQVIEALHMKLYSNNFTVKKNALGLIMTITKSNQNDFVFVFKKMVERCLETQSHDLIIIFLQTLASLEKIPYSDEFYKGMIDVVMSPLFSSNKESILYVLSFIDNLFLAGHPINSDISKTLFIYFCKHMRSLHSEVRLKSVKVLTKMNLSKVDEELILLSIKREKFQDYQNSGKKKTPEIQTPHKKQKNIESQTEKTVNQLEIKSMYDNLMVGCFHHVLEDESPDIRIAAIKALKVIGKIIPAPKLPFIKELLLYFLNDDFDKVRICSLRALKVLFSEISLTTFDLDTFYYNLKEKIYELRAAIYRLLRNFAPKNSTQVILLFRRLVENLRLFREDAPWIYKTLVKIFQKNKRYQLEILTALYFSDQGSIIQEKDIKDPEAVVRIILLSNSLRHSPQLLERFPHYFRKHVILLKETYPDLIYDVDNDDNNVVISMKNNIFGDDLMRTFVKGLNEQIRGKENRKLKKMLKNFEGLKSSSTHSRSLQMIRFCDRLIGLLAEYKMELSTILPNKRKILKIIFEIFRIKCILKLSDNLIRFLNLCEGFFWVQFLYIKIKTAQLKKEINTLVISSIISTLYESAAKVSSVDKTGQLAKLCGFLRPLMSNLSHSSFLTNTNLLSLFLSFTNEFRILEFTFNVEDFSQISKKQAFIHPKDDETEIIEVIPRYPFNFCVYVETDLKVIHLIKLGS